MTATTSAVTFLFTDIEGSTRLWEDEPTRMADALARHDSLCRIAVAEHGGRLVKMVGDGLYAVFDDPSAAIASTLELQRGVAAIANDCGLTLKIRCGLHAGVPQVRDGDYFGSAVNRTARLVSAAHGGQILLSQAVVDLARGTLGSDADVLHLGRVRLRDLSAPEDVWQLVAADLPQTFPALRSLDSAPNNLPQQPTHFIGREKEIDEVKALIRKTRLLTLTGAGGCGKTRLALQVAADQIEERPDGVWLVELAALTDPALVPQTTATTLGLKEQAGKSLTQTLTDHLQSRHLLLILDNAEHLLGSVARLADAILRRCPEVTLLVSSREALAVGGELTYRVPSLTMPDPARDRTPEAVARYESVRLFVERAQLLAPQFTVTPGYAPVLASICHRLDGIPLAIELAAARVRSMSVEEVNRRLDQRFRLLTGGSRTALPRQQTLRSAIDWSYDLLNGDERVLFARLAVFTGGFSLDAVERICADAVIDESAALDLVTSIVDKNLVVAETRGSATRYRMLETIRQYARDRLLDSGEGDRLRDLHLSYFAALAAKAEPKLSGPDQALWLHRLAAEHDNLRAALAWSSAAAGDTAAGLKMAAALWRFWYVRGDFSEGRACLVGLLSIDNAGATPERGRALNAAGTLAWLQTDLPAARTLLSEALVLWRAHGDRQGIARSLSNLGNVAHGECDYAASRGFFEQSLAIRRELDDRAGIADILTNLGALAYDRGDYDAAGALFSESLGLRRERGDRWGIAVQLNNLGAVHDAQGDYSGCRALYEECLAIYRELGDRSGEPTSLSNLGQLASAEGDHVAARALHEESLSIRRETGDRRGIVMELNNLAKEAIIVGEPARARALALESLAVLQELSDRRLIAEALEALAGAAAADGAPERATRILGCVGRLREEVGYPLRPREIPAHERQMTALRSAMGGDGAFDAAMQEGRTMTLENAIAFAGETQKEAR